MYIYQRLDQQ